ncbi:MAG: hypothetical protein HY930_04030, partial [Euryarchaeota archaeon]|nr:hypothetical protein [Euryarchaeota archaeon]
LSIGAGLEAEFMDESFHTANLSLGCYNATATANYSTYGSENETTSERVGSFCIQPPPPTPPSGVTSGAAGVTRPIVPPPQAAVNFAKTPVLIEVRPGEKIVTGIAVENPSTKDVTLEVKVSGVPERWVDVMPRGLFIAAGKSNALNIGLDIPSGAWPGDYKVDINLEGDTPAENFFFLRVKSYPSEYEKPAVTRIVEIDRSESKTLVSIKVENSGRFVDALEVVENIPEELAHTADQINFTAPPPEILEPDPVVKWVFGNLEQYETRRVSYEVPKVLDEYSPYVYWPVGQVNIFYVKKKDLAVPLRVQEINIPTLIPGRAGNISVNLMNFETMPLTITAKFELPAGWSLYPEEITTSLPPRTLSTLNFAVTPSSDTAPGAYTIAFRIFYGTQEIERGSIVFVQQPLLRAPFGYIRRNLLVFAVLIFAALLASVYRRRKRKRYRVEAVSRVREMRAKMLQAGERKD